DRGVTVHSEHLSELLCFAGGQSALIWAGVASRSHSSWSDSTMDRRAVLRGISAGTLIAGTLPARGQTPGKVPRIVLLLVGTPELWPDALALFRNRLRELGYIEGKSVLIEERYAHYGALTETAREIVASKPDIIVTPTVAASTAARQATS